MEQEKEDQRLYFHYIIYAVLIILISIWLWSSSNNADKLHKLENRPHIIDDVLQEMHVKYNEIEKCKKTTEEDYKFINENREKIKQKEPLLFYK